MANKTDLVPALEGSPEEERDKERSNDDSGEWCSPWDELEVVGPLGKVDKPQRVLKKVTLSWAESTSWLGQEWEGKVYIEGKSSGAVPEAEGELSSETHRKQKTTKRTCEGEAPRVDTAYTGWWGRSESECTCRPLPLPACPRQESPRAGHTACQGQALRPPDSGGRGRWTAPRHPAEQTLQCGSGPGRAQVWGQRVLGEGRGGRGRCRSQAGAPSRSNTNVCG